MGLWLPRNRKVVVSVVKEVGIDAGLAVLQAGLTALYPTPEGAMAIGAASSAVSDIAKRFLSPKEEARVDEVARLAAAKLDELRHTSALRSDLNPVELGRLLEGTLLAAKDSYEEKKLPLLANLAARAPFTNTPVANLVGCLDLAERLTYRQLCLLSLIPYDTHQVSRLTTRSLQDLLSTQPLSEAASGILYDLEYLVGQNLAGEVVGGAFNTGIASINMAPARLRLTYQGMLLWNGMVLGAIPPSDLEEILHVLGSQGVPG
jgi:hypothetical protein